MKSADRCPLNAFSLSLLLGLAFGSDLFGAGLVGDWSLTLPSQEAGWLSVRDDGGHHAANLLWAVGSAKSVTDLEVKNGILSFKRSIRRPLSPKEEPAVLNRIEARAEGDVLHCTMQPVHGGDVLQFTGRGSSHSGVQARRLSGANGEVDDQEHFHESHRDARRRDSEVSRNRGVEVWNEVDEKLDAATSA